MKSFLIYCLRESQFHSRELIDNQLELYRPFLCNVRRSLRNQLQAKYRFSIVNWILRDIFQNMI